LRKRGGNAISEARLYLGADLGRRGHSEIRFLFAIYARP